jgi:hypothetical protein
MFATKRSYSIKEPFFLINEHFYPLTNKIGHTIFLKLEDLHLNSFMTMKKLSVHLNLVWDDKLLHSTFNNKVWWNYSASLKISGFNKSIVKIKKYKILSDLNLKILNSLFFSTNKVYTYENKSKKYNVFLAIFLMFVIPFRFEILGFRAADKKIKDVFFILNEYFLLRIIIISTILKTYNYRLQRKFPFLKKNNPKKKFINGLK